MSHSENKLVPENAIFDRLVDGELSATQRHELLSSLDGQSDGWRRCALAFLEAQAWRSEMKSFVAQQEPPTAVQAAATMPTSRPARPSREVRWFEGSLALAATALLAFGIGWKTKSPNTAVQPGQSLASSDAPAPQRSGDPRDAVTLVVQDERGKPQRLRLPLVDAGKLGDQWTQLSPDVPIDLRTGLRDRGFDLKSKQRFAPLFFEQNKQLVPMVVPVNDTYVVPVNRPVY